MDIIIIVWFCLLGIVLILLEIFLIPGVAFMSIAGIFSVVFGVHRAFYYLGFRFGAFVFCLSILVIIIFVIYMIRSKFLDRIALNSKIESTVSVIDESILNICEGDEGVTISRLNPIGKVEVNSIIMEGKSLSKFIDEDTKVVVMKVFPTQLIVKIK